MPFSKVYIRFFFALAREKSQTTQLHVVITVTTSRFFYTYPIFFSPWPEKKRQTTQLHGIFECVSRSGEKDQNLTTCSYYCNYIPIFLYISDFFSPWPEKKSQTTQLHAFFECASRSCQKDQNLTTCS